MREIHAALERFDAALSRLETALDRGLTPPADAAPEAAGLIERLKRENEALRAARAREASLRVAALRRVDVAIAALEATIDARADLDGAAGRSRAMFGPGPDVPGDGAVAQDARRAADPARAESGRAIAG